MNHLIHKQPNCQLPFYLYWLRLGGAESNDRSIIQRQVNAQNQTDIDPFLCFKTARNVAAKISPHICRLHTFTESNRNSDQDDRMETAQERKRISCFLRVAHSTSQNCMEFIESDFFDFYIGYPHRFREPTDQMLTQQIDVHAVHLTLVNLGKN